MATENDIICSLLSNKKKGRPPQIIMERMAFAFFRAYYTDAQAQLLRGKT